MDMYSGMVLDYEVLSNFCAARTTLKKEETFDDWHNTVHSEKCQVNFQGLSAAMESGGAVRMWQRSKIRGYRYVTFLGDGDSSSYKAVCNMNNGNGPYTSHSVVKECVNHILKRIGTQLRKLKEELKEKL